MTKAIEGVVNALRFALRLSEDGKHGDGECPTCYFVRDARKALTEYERAPSPTEGWKLVPVEPTEEMLDSAGTQFLEGLGEYKDGAPNTRPFARLYKAMLAAAPVHQPKE